MKTKQEWEAEMLDCLEEAKRRISGSSGEERTAAVAHYREVLVQFNELIVRGKVPPEQPCYQ